MLTPEAEGLLRALGRERGDKEQEVMREGYPQDVIENMFLPSCESLELLWSAARNEQDYNVFVTNMAAKGNVIALVELRRALGLPIFS